MTHVPGGGSCLVVDASSRKLALDLLNREALRLQHRQFVFITPQDLSSVHPSDSVSMHATLRHLPSRWTHCFPPCGSCVVGHRCVCCAWPTRSAALRGHWPRRSYKPWIASVEGERQQASFTQTGVGISGLKTGGGMDRGESRVRPPDAIRGKTR